MKTLLIILCCVVWCAAFASADDAAEPRRHARRERAAALDVTIETYVDNEGWQTGVGYREMQRYIQRLAIICEENLQGIVLGVAGGKRGVLLRVSPQRKVNLTYARENTEEFLTAIVNDLAAFPEPVATTVHVVADGNEIIRAEKRGDRVRVRFLE